MQKKKLSKIKNHARNKSKVEIDNKTATKYEYLEILKQTAIFCNRSKTINTQFYFVGYFYIIQYIKLNRVQTNFRTRIKNLGAFCKFGNMVKMFLLLNWNLCDYNILLILCMRVEF